MGDLIKKDHFLTSYIEDLIAQTRDYYYCAHTDFLDMHEQTVVLKHIQKLGVAYVVYGGYELAERKQIHFKPQADYELDLEASIHLVKVTLPKVGLNRLLNHRDYLGALMNMGIDRKLIGDLLPQKDCCIIFCMDTISDYICKNLIQIGNVNVRTSIESDTSVWQDYTPEFTRIKGTIASNRLDSIIKVGTKLSRSNSVQYIKAGKVFINGRETLSSGLSVAEGSIISVRGKGKFKLVSIGNISKKGRVYIELDLYI